MSETFSQNDGYIDPKPTNFVVLGGKSTFSYMNNGMDFRNCKEKERPSALGHKDWSNTRTRWSTPM